MWPYILGAVAVLATIGGVVFFSMWLVRFYADRLVDAAFSEAAANARVNNDTAAIAALERMAAARAKKNDTQTNLEAGKF